MLLVTVVRKYLAESGLKPEDQSGHSFQIGAVTTAASRWVPVETIMTLGHWKSQTYGLYVSLPGEQLAGLSRTLAAS